MRLFRLQTKEFDTPHTRIEECWVVAKTMTDALHNVRPRIVKNIEEISDNATAVDYGEENAKAAPEVREYIEKIQSLKTEVPDILEDSWSLEKSVDRKKPSKRNTCKCDERKN